MKQQQIDSGRLQRLLMQGQLIADELNETLHTNMGKISEELAQLWDEYGDKEMMFWEPGMQLPEPIE